MVMKAAVITFGKIFLLMKKLLIALLVLIIAAVAAWKFGVFGKDEKPGRSKDQPISVSKHSDSFNQSLTETLNAYYTLTESFVNWDTAKVNSSIAALKLAVDSIPINEIEKDSAALYETAKTFWESAKSEIQGMQLDTTLYEKREGLNMLTDNLFNLLRTVQYDAAKVYYNECPMAMENNGTEVSAFWLSNNGNKKDLRNPYLGLYHPKYGKAMLDCGSVRDSIRTETEPTGK
jgi:hypothetical protein